MTNHFPTFARMVADDFRTLTQTSHAFVIGTGDDDALWTLYLASFPSGTDPVFKKRTEHDCACCRQFIRRAGNVVAVVDGALRTAWDRAAEEAPHPYDVVATRLRDALRECYITDLYRVGKNEASFGAEESHSLDKETQRVLTWNHFYTGPIAGSLRVASPDADRGAYRTTVQVFQRGLEELKPDAVDTVFSLIEANGLYRGEEHGAAVRQFRDTQRAYLALESDWSRNIFVWTEASGPAARFRNTVIGTLVQDLSEGKDVEPAWKDVSEENFVENAKTAEHERREAALEVVKRVIDVKLAEEAAAKKRAESKLEKEKLLKILAEKQDGKLSALSEKELQKRIAALGE